MQSVKTTQRTRSNPQSLPGVSFAPSPVHSHGTSATPPFTQGLPRPTDFTTKCGQPAVAGALAWTIARRQRTLLQTEKDVHSTGVSRLRPCGFVLRSKAIIATTTQSLLSPSVNHSLTPHSIFALLCPVGDDIVLACQVCGGAYRRVSSKCPSGSCLRFAIQIPCVDGGCEEAKLWWFQCPHDAQGHSVTFRHFAYPAWFSAAALLLQAAKATETGVNRSHASKFIAEERLGSAGGLYDISAYVKGPTSVPHVRVEIPDMLRSRSPGSSEWDNRPLETIECSW